MLSNLHRSESSIITSTDGEKSVDSVKTPSEDDALPSDDESKYIVGRKLYLINVSLIVCLFIVQIESSIISTAVVDITDQLGGYEKSSWLFTAYLLSYCGTHCASPF
jgi:ABC-type microcin C transport system permease subunit YejE